MKWVSKAAESGDIVRVRLGSIYHYGIFVNENEVIQFGLPPVNSASFKANDQEVCKTDVNKFLCGGLLEVAVADSNGKTQRRSANDTVAAARSRLGERGYNILYNNCEHFVYECAYGEKYSSQTEALRAAWHSMPVLDVYTAEIPEGYEVGAVFPPSRQQEIECCSNRSVKRQKYAVWKLLEYGLKRTFGYDIKKLEFVREANGKWRCGPCEFSLSHSKNVVAVALSRQAVGIDIEGVSAVKPELATKILSEKELAAYSSLTVGREEYLSRKWTEKESIFKKTGGAVFCPSKIDTEGQNLKTERLTVSGEEYFFTVASDCIAKFRFIPDIKLS